jgi:hypothetical protein
MEGARDKPTVQIEGRSEGEIEIRCLPPPGDGKIRTEVKKQG